MAKGWNDQEDKTPRVDECSGLFRAYHVQRKISDKLKQPLQGHGKYRCASMVMKGMKQSLIVYNFVMLSNSACTRKHKNLVLMVDG